MKMIIEEDLNLLVVDYSIQPPVDKFRLEGMSMISHPDCDDVVAVDLRKLKSISPDMVGGKDMTRGQLRELLIARGIKLADARILQELAEQPYLVPTEFRDNQERLFLGSVFGFPDDPHSFRVGKMAWNYHVENAEVLRVYLDEACGPDLVVIIDD